MTMQTAKIDASKDTASLEVLIGQRQRGSYYVRLFNPATGVGTVIGEGFSWDDQPDVFPIPDGGDIQSLDGCVVYWDIQITSSSPKAGEYYAATVMIRQDHVTVPDGVWQKAGELSGTVPVTDGLVLCVASAADPKPSSKAKSALGAGK